MTTEQLLFFLKLIISALNCDIKTWSISYWYICHVAKWHCVCFGVFLSIFSNMFHFLYFLGKSLKSEPWGGEEWEFITSKRRAVSRMVSTILVPVTVIFAHKGYHKMGQHVAFGFSITNYGFTSNLTLKKRIPRCNKIMNIAVLESSRPREHRGYLHCSGVGCYSRCRKLDLPGW